MAAQLTSKTLQQALRLSQPFYTIDIRVFPTKPADMLIKVDVIYKGADTGSLVTLTFDRTEPIEDVVRTVEAAGRALGDAKALPALKARAPRRARPRRDPPSPSQRRALPLRRQAAATRQVRPGPACHR
jgi:hypothetical protein